MATNPEMSRRSKPWRRTALAAALLAGTSLGGYALGNACVAATDPSSTPAAESTGAPVNPSGTQLSNHTLPDFTALVEKVKPAVVSITTKLNEAAAQQAEGDSDQMQMPQLP
ncbi:MAG: hypothetical protein JOZ17_02185, partial [Acetobacteraceae bacterium]|nr:hypothetical protein [Acetobacteraceae bacterium]